MKPEDLLHLFAPYLPTDRFRALLRGVELPQDAHGAAMLVDMQGFSPLAKRLVEEFGPQRASDELKRRLNPMFEVVAGQVFNHGGSVIRFLGDGFTAWFDDQIIGEPTLALPGVLRAVAAGISIQDVVDRVQRRWQIRLKVCVGMGSAARWVLGLPQFGRTDLLSGVAVQAALSLSAETASGQVMVHHDSISLLREHGIEMLLSEQGNALIQSVPDSLFDSSRAHRWAAWEAQGDAAIVLDTVRPYVMRTAREHVERGLGDYVGELRYGIPMFIKLNIGTRNIGTVHSDSTQRSLDAYVCYAQQLLSDYGGQLMSVEVSDKGYVLFAVFGAPVTYGDDAERAVRAAMTLRNARLPNSIVTAQSIGLSRGLLYAGTIGGEVRHEYSTIGDETNVAARLMSAAGNGRILASSAVYKAVGARVAFEMLPDIWIKGREDAIPVAEPIAFRVGGVRETKFGVFVGRSSELEQLVRLLKPVRAGHSCVARIEGEAGIGKSHLVSELSRRAIDQQIRVVIGECFSTGQLTTFLPWQTIIAALLNLHLEGDSAEVIAQMNAMLVNFLPNSASWLPLLGDIVGVAIPNTPATASLDGQTRQNATFALVNDLIHAIARQQPLLIVVEDAQWIDESSASLAVYFLQQLTVNAAPILLLAVHRPLQGELPASRLMGALAAHRRSYHWVLEELSRAETALLLAKRFSHRVADNLVNFVYERAQGNPFFVLEVAEALQEAKSLETTTHGVDLAVGSTIFNLPQTVQGIVQARIDSLSETDRLILKVAAVVGRDFPVDIVARSLPKGLLVGSDLTKRLAALRDLGYIYPIKEQSAYAFKHAIVQEVIYQSLLAEQRQDLHHAVALALQQATPDAIEPLAYHFARSNDHGEGFKYQLEAGLKALKEYANYAALEYFAHAEILMQTDASRISDQQRFELWMRQVNVLLRLGETQAVLRRLPEGIRIAETSANPEWQAIVHLLYAEYYTQISAWTEARHEAQVATSLAESIKNDRLAWQGYLIQRNVMRRLNMTDDLDRKMQAIATRLGDLRYVIELLLTWFDEMYADSPEFALQAAQTTLNSAREQQDLVLEAECLSVLTELYRREYNLPAALESARSRIILLRQIGDRRREGLTLVQLAELYLHLGQIAEGQNLTLEAYQTLQLVGDRSGLAAARVLFATIAELLGEYQSALSDLRRATLIQSEIKADDDMARTQFHSAVVAILCDDFALAEQELNTARAFFERTGRYKFGISVGELDAAHAMILMARGDLDSALSKAQPMIMRLSRGQLSGIYRPGVACAFILHILEANGQAARAKQIRTSYQVSLREKLVWLEARGWREDFVRRVWYNAVIFKV